MNKCFDLIIVGGGSVGPAVALALSKAHVPPSIALIDAGEEKSAGERYLALNHDSIGLLEQCGAWGHLSAFAAPIRKVHVSKQGAFGRAILDAQDVQLEALGHVVPASRIQTALYERMKDAKNIALYQPATLHSADFGPDRVRVQVLAPEGPLELEAPWLIGTDGMHSMVRSLLGIATETIDYQQAALVTVTELKRAHHHIAYERFLSQGAIALLPLLGNQVATIWTAPSDAIRQLAELTDEDFLKTAQAQFGYRLGRFEKCHARKVFPLTGLRAKEFKKGRAWLLGNALHTMHPIAAQGLNRAFKETAELAAFFNHNQTFEGFEFSARPYWSDQLLWAFSKGSFFFSLLRSVGLAGLDVVGPLKKRFIQFAMGRTDGFSRLFLKKGL